MKFVSVIIPAHNEEKYIQRTLDSYLQQKSRKIPHELVVVANGCDAEDRTADIASDLGARVIELEHGNVSVARNKGVENAKGQLIIFNDADTLVAPNYLRAVCSADENGYGVGCAMFKPENYHPFSILYSLANEIIGSILESAGGNMFVDRRIFEKINGFNPELITGEDADLSRRMKKAGARFKFLHCTYVMTSLRKFEENGYLKEFFVNRTSLFVKGYLFPSLFPSFWS